MPEAHDATTRKNDTHHIPVMLDQVRHYLARKSTRVIVDCTVGTGGHARALLEDSPEDSILIGIDLDETALGQARERLSEFGERVLLRKMNFANLLDKLDRSLVGKVDALLVDCGISQPQIVSKDRGFSFDRESPIDMRFDTSAGLSAASLLASLGLEDLTVLLKQFGERRAKGIAKAMMRRKDAGKLTTTLDIAVAVKSAVKVMPAKSLARVFLALRATVNDELKNLERLLESLPGLLASSGRICVISYHSLEDRIVKTHFRRLSGKCVCPPGSLDCTCGKVSAMKLLTAKPLRPSSEEVQRNPSARSAKMRVAEKM